MGLDMFLSVVSKKTEREHTIGEWGRDRAIFNWFEDCLGSVENKTIINCKYYPVTREDIERLRNDCEKVISLYNEKGEELTEEDVGSLKPSFNHTFDLEDIHEGYLYQLEKTLEILDRVEFFDLRNNDLMFEAWW